MTRFDPATAGLDEIAAGDILQFSEADCWTMAPRAHEAVLELEGRPTRRNRAARWRLHALAAELAEYGGNPMRPYYAIVNGLTVNLHDLRNAQLLREDPTLVTEAATPLSEERRETILWLLDAPGDLASADAALVLGQLRYTGAE